MLAVLCLVALAASALGSPSVLLHAGSHGLRDAQDFSYTVQVVKSGITIAPAALILDQYAICSKSLLGSAVASDLSVRVGTDVNIPYVNLKGKKIGVLSVLVHPARDVAVLKLKEAAPNKLARPIAVTGPQSALPGSFAEVSAWGWLKRSLQEAVVVLPKYCAIRVPDPKKPAPGVCAKTDLQQKGGLLVVGDAVVGIALSPGKDKSRNDLVWFVDLAEEAVQSFILQATEQPLPTPPNPTGAPTRAPPTGLPPSPPPPAFSTEVPPPPAPSSEAPLPTTEAPPAPSTVKPTPPNPSGKTCKIHVNGGLPIGEPLLLVDGEVLAFRDPDSADAVVLAAGESLRFVCSGDKNYFQLDKSKQVLTAQCVEDDAFLVDGQSVELHQLGCKKAASNSAVRSGRCGSEGQFTSISIGFQVGDDFITQIDNCFDGRTFDAVYSRMNMTPALAGHESGVKRPQFTPADFYENLSPNTLFKRTNQVKAFTKLLGKDASTYVHPNNDNYFLARGHLSAKADYILGVQQSATFYYVNAAPQWQTFNGDNWEKLESSVRDWVISSGRTVQVITGIWGTATLPNKDGVETELYLEADKKFLRVPKYYWKIVYDPATKEGTAFVGLNNPHHATTDEDVFCKDECARYPWLSWAASNEKAGAGFCCDVNELRKVVTTVPDDVSVQGLL